MEINKRIAVNKRLGMDLRLLGLDQQVVREVLSRLGFEITAVDITSVAKGCIGKAYRRGALQRDAPSTFDCSSLTKFCYAQLGIWLPRYSIQQYRSGEVVQGELKPGDLVFAKGWRGYWDEQLPDGIGHVALYIGKGVVVEAANFKVGVVERLVAKFTQSANYRGAVRIVPNLNSIVTIGIPDRWEDAETIEDIKWIVLSNLPTNK